MDVQKFPVEVRGASGYTKRVPGRFRRVMNMPNGPVTSTEGPLGRSEGLLERSEGPLSRLDGPLGMSVG